YNADLLQVELFCCLAFCRTSLSSHPAHEMPARKLASENGTRRVHGDVDAGCEPVEWCPIRAYNVGNGITMHIEHDVEYANTVVPEYRHGLHAIDGTRMQQAIAACRIRCHGKGVARRISERNIRVLFHTQVTTSCRFTIECRRQ